MANSTRTPRTLPTRPVVVAGVTYNAQVCPPRTVRGAHTARAWRPLGRATAACAALGKGRAPSR